METEAPANNRQDFPDTRWSIVLAAAREAGAQPALAWLCERYWFPLFAYVRGRGVPPEDAEDLVQGFFAQLLEANTFAQADAERGRFRSFLLGCLRHFMAHEWRDARRLKRGGSAVHVPLDGHDAEARLARDIPSRGTPEQDFDRAWAVTLLDNVAEQVRAECEADGNDGRFAVLESFLMGDRGEVPLAAAAEKLGVSLAAAKSIVHRLRRRFREKLMLEIRETVTGPEEVQRELEHLLAALAG